MDGETSCGASRLWSLRKLVQPPTANAQAEGRCSALVETATTRRSAPRQFCRRPSPAWHLNQTTVLCVRFMAVAGPLNLPRESCQFALPIGANLADAAATAIDPVPPAWPSGNPGTGSSPPASPISSLTEPARRPAGVRTSIPCRPLPCHSENARRTADRCWSPAPSRAFDSWCTPSSKPLTDRAQDTHLATVVIAPGADPYMQTQAETLHRRQLAILFLRHQFGGFLATQHVRPLLPQTSRIRDRRARPTWRDAAPPNSWTN